jgi:hypothetical protein
MEIKGNLLYVASHQNLLLIDLNSASITESIFVPESDYLGHIALDSSHYVYVTDWSAQKLFRINIIEQSSTTLYNFNSMPVGISYEQNNHRLIILTLVDNAPILAYNLNGGNIDTVRNTSINDPDAICRDGNGNYFVTSFSDNIVYRFGNDFLSGPEIISSGHGGPSGIGYNMHDNLIGVTNYNFNSINLIQLKPSEVKPENNVELYNFILFQNYPNPFNPATTIRYKISSRQYVQLKVYDVLGNEIETLVNEEKPAGNYNVEFDGSELPSGIYYYKLQTDNYVETKKMLLLK